MATTPLINGVNYAWSNITWGWYTLPLIGIRSINYELKQKKELNYGQGTKPISIAYGNYEPTAEIEIYLDEWNKIIAAAPNNDPMQIPGSDFQVSFGGSRVQSKTDVLQLAEFTNDPVSVKQGDTIVAIKLTLILADIIHK